MSNILDVVGKNIKFFRRARGITQEMLAEKADISGSYVGYLERGEKLPSLELLAKIAAILQVEPAVLLALPEDESNQELKKLIAILSGKGPNLVKFMSDVAVAYLKSQENNNIIRGQE